MIYRIKRATRHVIFWSIMFIAFSLTTVRIMLYLIEDYKVLLTGKIAERVGAPVTIGGLSTQMRGYQPQLVISDVHVLSTDQTKESVISFREIRLGINLLDFVSTGSYWASSWITLVGVKLEVKRKADGSIGIVGLRAGDEKPLWLLQGGKYEVLQSTVTWRDEMENSKPLVFEAVDMAILNKQNQHTINVLMNLPAKLGKSLTVSMLVTGNPFEPSAINAFAYFDGKALNLPLWMTLDLPQNIKFQSGTGNVKVWSRIYHSRLVAVDAQTVLKQAVFLRPDNSTLSFKSLQSTFNWLNNKGQWKLIVNQFLLESQERKWTDVAFSASGFSSEDGLLHKLGLYIREMDLQQASLLGQFFAPLDTEQRNLLLQAHPKGLLKQLSFFADLDNKQGAVNGEFGKLAMEPILAIPGFTNLNGHIRGSEQQGWIAINGNNGTINYPAYFRDSIAVTKLETSIDWQQSADFWTFSSANLSINLPGFQAKSRFLLNLPKDKQLLFLDMEMSFASDDVRQIAHYVPKRIMDPNFDIWLDQAFYAGRISNGSLVFQGNVSQYPFSCYPGIFKAQFTAQNIDLSYNPEWPRIKELNGELLVNNEALLFKAKSGHSNNLTIRQAEISLPVIGKSLSLGVKGELEGKIVDVLDYLEVSPLVIPTEKLLDAIIPEGNTTVKLDTWIPLVSGIELEMYGSADFKDAKLTAKQMGFELENINGQLEFDETGTFANGIKAVLFGQPLLIGMEVNDQHTSVNATGTAELSRLVKQFKLPEISFAKGAFDYLILLKLFNDNRAPSLQFTSDLQGLSLALPDDLAKSRDEQRPLLVDFDFSKQDVIPVNVNYDQKLKAVININSKQQTMQSASVLVGTGDVSKSLKSGIRLELNREKLILENWLGDGFENATAGKTVNTDQLKEIIVHSQKASWNGVALGEFDVNLKHLKKYWQGTLANKFAQGTVEIPENIQGENRITVSLDKLDLEVFTKLKPDTTNAKRQPATESLPLISFTSDKTLWNGVDTGKLVVENQRAGNGIIFNKIDLQNADHHLSMTGDWHKNTTNSTSHFEGHLTMPEAGEQFSKLGISNDLSETTAEFKINVSWPGMPQQFSTKFLQGRLDLSLKNGRILSIEPGGLGRIIGILAMEQWLKRLRLDFGDVYKEGLSFNTISGHFDFSNGMAVTRNLSLDAVPAIITINGSYDLVKGDMDFIISVVPKSVEFVPIAGNIMGKVSSFIGRVLTGRNQDGFLFGSEYRVTGTFGKFTVTPVHEKDGVFQKTWQGISSFPWIGNN
jgi:uncharacterized protein (TIGR02099 family)